MFPFSRQTWRSKARFNFVRVFDTANMAPCLYYICGLVRGLLGYISGRTILSMLVAHKRPTLHLPDQLTRPETCTDHFQIPHVGHERHHQHHLGPVR